MLDIEVESVILLCSGVRGIARLQTKHTDRVSSWLDVRKTQVRAAEPMDSIEQCITRSCEGYSELGGMENDNGECVWCCLFSQTCINRELDRATSHTAFRACKRQSRFTRKINTGQCYARGSSSTSTICLLCLGLVHTFRKTKHVSG